MPKKRPTSASTRAAHGPALGVVVTPRTAYAVLLEATPGGSRIVRRLTRNRSQHAAVVDAARPAEGFDSYGAEAHAHGFGAQRIEDGGAMLEFGAAGDHVGDLFLTSEFGDLQQNVQRGVPEAPTKLDTFTLELQDFLTECREGLRTDPMLALVSAPGDAVYAELRVADLGKEKAARRAARVQALLHDAVPDADAARALFLPMTPAEDGTERVLAVAPRREDSTTETLRQLREVYGGRPPARLIDTELTLFIGLARLAEATSPRVHGDGVARPDLFSGDSLGDGTSDDAALSTAAGSTLVVRAGLDETFVLVLREGALHHFAHLRAITTYDAPETICSRLLLEQDEHGLGEFSRVLVRAEQNEAALLEHLRFYFPGARAEGLVHATPDVEEAATGNPDDAFFLPAYAAALRLVGPAEQVEAFPEINLLPKELTKRRRVVPYTWHVYALIGLLFATVFFFTTRYFTLKAEIETQEARVTALAPEVLELSVLQLQARIDSLTALQQQLSHSLTVLDTLLIGSDRWSRALEKLSVEAANVRGVWVERWEADSTYVTLVGNATARDRIVRLAERVGGEIESLTFAEIRDFPVFTYRIRLPLSRELPEAARYLREQVQVDTAATRSLRASASPAP